MNLKPTLIGCSLIASVCLLTACNRSDSTPKAPPKPAEQPQAAKPALPPGHPPIDSGTSMSSQNLPPGAMATAKNPEWTVPKDWQPGKQSSMRRGSWTVNGPEGQTADIAVTVFPGDVGGQLANINRWRVQIGLGAVTETEAVSMTTKLSVGDAAVSIVDFTNPTPATGGTFPQRMIVAIIPHGGDSWFIKMTGAAPLVEAQQQAFLDFVKSVKF